MTVAADAASEALRYRMEKRIREEHVLRSAELGAKHGMNKLKLYTIAGLPGEQDADLEELARFVGEVATLIPVAVTSSVFVPKYNTPMATAPFAGIREAKARIRTLERAFARIGGGSHGKGRRNKKARAASERSSCVP